MKPTTLLSASATLLSLGALLAACAPSPHPASPGPDGPTENCSTEARACPDGSMVGRTEPHCEFAACPGPAPKDGGPGGHACTEEAKLCPDGSAVGRTGPACEFAPCPGADASTGGGAACKNTCGNGTCEEMVCQALGCPCAESKASCPQDCK